MKKVTKGNVTIKLWDIGGQPRFRGMWERYCRGVNAIVYVIIAFFPLSFLLLLLLLFFLLYDIFAFSFFHIVLFAFGIAVFIYYLLCYVVMIFTE